MDVSSSNAPPFIYILLKKKCVLIAVYSVVAYHGLVVRQVFTKPNLQSCKIKFSTSSSLRDSSGKKLHQQPKYVGMSSERVRFLSSLRDSSGKELHQHPKFVGSERVKVSSSLRDSSG